uniref:Uncharacterized protein n=1 Tax=Ditylenchus dipsaci TaxID=166011 RepID=A0A915EHH0_9BILA
MKVFFPCILLVVASWLHFWIHGSWSVPRTISAAAPFFILVAVLFLLPSPTRAMVVWLVLCVLITFCSFLEYFLVICCGIHQRVRYTNGLLHPTTTNTISHDEDRELQRPPRSQSWKWNTKLAAPDLTTIST